MSDDELGELAADIKAHGLKQPIVTWSPGYVGDGVKLPCAIAPANAALMVEQTDVSVRVR